MVHLCRSTRLFFNEVAGFDPSSRPYRLKYGGPVFQAIRTGAGIKTGDFVEKKTRAATEVHHFFSEVFQFESLTLFPKADLENNKNCYVPDEKSHSLRYTMRIMQKKLPISDDFGLRSVLSHSETISDENC